MMLFSFTILTIAFDIAAATQKFPTSTDITYARTAINQIIDDNQEFPSNNPEFPFIGGFVRLSFHDCVGPDHCDGCIDHSLDDNKGLLKYTEPLDTKYDGDTAIKDKMSRADFYMLAAYVALTRASVGLTPEFTGMDDFKVGRLDCPTSPVEDNAPINAFPVGIDNLPALTSFFLAEFGFDEKDTVAILGAHTLGRAHHTASGFEGKWVKGRDSANKAKSDLLDNDYYKQIRGKWVQMEVASGKFQWQRPDTPANTESDGRGQPNMFLNIDLAVSWDMETTGNIGDDGQVGCLVDPAPGSATNCADPFCCIKATSNQNPLSNNIFRTYVGDNNEWMKDFSNAFDRMTHSNDNAGTFQLPQ